MLGRKRLRVRKSARRQLGQFYTPQPVAQLLVQQSPPRAKKIFDLGVGLGALSHAASNRYPGARIFGIDIDIPNGTAPVQGASDIATVTCADLSNPENWSDLRKRLGRADLVLANPPYGKVASNAHLLGMLHTMSLRASRAAHVRLELVFLCAGIYLARNGGALSFVLPYSIMEYTSWGLSPDWLTSFAGLRKVIQLPPKVFRGTEVRAGLFMFSPSHSTDRISSFRLSRGDLLPIARNNKGRLESHHLSMRDLGVEVRRGHYSKATLERSGQKYFHTSSFSEARRGMLYLAGRPSSHPDHLLAEEGDILLPRVGTRCLEREAIVMRGTRIITDCILRIRPPDNVRAPLWKFLRSERGRRWRLSLARGSCAQFLPQAALAETPVPI
jgi:predicted RNA methylase